MTKLELIDFYQNWLDENENLLKDDTLTIETARELELEIEMMTAFISKLNELE